MISKKASIISVSLQITEECRHKHFGLGKKFILSFLGVKHQPNVFTNYKCAVNS